jgi:hypothetical protein
MKLKLVLVPFMPGAVQLLRIVAMFKRANVRLQVSENVISVPRSFRADHEVGIFDVQTYFQLLGPFTLIVT